jgi:hypothetical protein
MSPDSLQAADGDQFLDGIGETSLISRHIFAGDLDDWSRNGLDASARGGAPRFVEDETFTQVLSLSGGTDGTFVEVPTSGIGDGNSLSITGWVRLAQNEGSRWVFDLGSNQGPKLGMEFVPAKEKDGYTITLTAGETKIQASAASVQAGQWVHLSTVFDATEKTASLYLDGKRIEQAKDVRLSLRARRSIPNPPSRTLRRWPPTRARRPAPRLPLLSERPEPEANHRHSPQRHFRGENHQSRG